MSKFTNLLLIILIGVISVFGTLFFLSKDKENTGDNVEDNVVVNAQEMLYSVSVEKGYVGEYSTWYSELNGGLISYRFLEENIEWKNKTVSTVSTETISNDGWELLYCSNTNGTNFYDQLQTNSIAVNFRQYYNVYFISNTDEVISTQTVLRGQPISPISINNKNDHTFAGWFNNNSEWSVSYDKVYTSLTLEAKWNSASNLVFYHNVTGASNPNPSTYTNGGDDILLQNASMNGYQFVGWYSDFYLMNQVNYINGSSTSSINLFAKWTLQEYNIVYNLNGGTNNLRNPEKYSIETEMTLSAPTKAGCTFLGWKLNGSFFKEVSIKDMTGDFYLEAVWDTTQYNIIYVLNGGTLLYSNPETYYVDEGNVTLNLPVKEGYEAKWSLYSDALVEVTTLNGELLEQMSSTTIILYAFYEADSIEGVVFEDVDQYGNEFFYMYYGYAAQTVVDDEDLIAQLDAQKLTDINGKYILNGIKYEKHTVSVYEEGYTYSNGEPVVAGETRYFSYDPIKWRIIQTVGSIQVLSEYILKQDIIYHTNVTRTINGTTINANNYRYSNINVWMDGDFCTSGFSTTQLENVKTVSTTYGQFYAPTYSTYTNETYGFDASDDADNKRSALVTDFALATGINQDENGCAEYWTSSTGTSSWNFMRSVRADGSMDTNRVVWTTGIGIRPAFTFIDFTIVS